MEVFGDNLRLNIGSGDKFIEGWIGIDAVPRKAARIVAPAHAIPLPDGCAAEVMSIHCVEHVAKWLVPPMFREWHRLLKPGGRLILEMPDIIKCCQNVIDGRTGKHPDQLGMWGLYGDDTLQDDFMLHKYGWCFKTIRPVLEECGFRDCVEEETHFHNAGRKHRDFRVVSFKR
jgi:predicted SAM-dependent methyltransferase